MSWSSEENRSRSCVRIVHYSQFGMYGMLHLIFSNVYMPGAICGNNGIILINEIKRASFANPEVLSEMFLNLWIISVTFRQSLS